MTVVERFLKYVSFDTQSDPDSESTPSTPKQKLLGQELVNEMHSMGIENARMDEHGYVYAHIDANTEGIPSLGFIAHMDTSSDASGADIKARIEKNYNGGDIRLNEHTVLSPVDFPKLLNSIGQDIIVTDGTTLLGADDKAGIAEILTMAEELINNPEIKHGKICIGFTPDEEVGRGADLFDVEGFGAEYAYTVDGGEIGEIEYENFNAASAKVSISGRGIHPGSAKDRMINSIHVAQEFDSMLPQAQRPEYHDMAKFEKKKSLMVKAAELVNLKYGEGTLKLTLNDSYYNMREKIQPHIWLVSNVQEIMRDLGVEPITTPVRGGTDGARLSFMGLPCPNICTGGLNFHGRFEYIPVQSMEKVCSILLEIVKRFR